MDLIPESICPKSNEHHHNHFDVCKSDETGDSSFQESSVSDNVDAGLCPICLDVFFTAQELLQHVLETYHVSSISSCSKYSKSFKSDTSCCPLCPDDEFQDTGDVLKHMFVKHYVTSETKCKKCSKDSIQQNEKNLPYLL